MRTVQVTALRKDFFEELRSVEAGGEPVEICRHGKSVAVLIPPAMVLPKNRKPSIDLNMISDFCKRYRVDCFFLFGSILRSDFNEESDVDIMVDVGDRCLGFSETCRMLDDLELMFGRKVDLLTRKIVESPLMNEHRRDSILSSARKVYDVTA